MELCESNNLTQYVRSALGTSGEETRERIRLFSEAMAKGIKEHKKAMFRGFGSIGLSVRYDANCRNPKTAEEFVQDRVIRVNFSASKNTTFIHND